MLDRAKLHANNQTDWATPQDLFGWLDLIWGPFDLDAAASSWSAKCEKYLDKEADALSIDEWPGDRIFLNPPFGRGLDRWLCMARSQADRGKVVCVVLPANTDTRWWHDHVLGIADHVEFLRGRVQFERPDGAPGRNTTGTAIAVYWGGAAMSKPVPKNEDEQNRKQKGTK